MSKSSENLIQFSPVSPLSDNVNNIAITCVVLGRQAFSPVRIGPGVGARAGCRRGTRPVHRRGGGTNVEGKDGAIRRYQSRCPSIYGGGAAASDRPGKTARWQGQAAAETAAGGSAPCIYAPRVGVFTRRCHRDPEAEGCQRGGYRKRRDSPLR